MLDLVQIEDHSCEVHDNKTGASLASFEVYVNPFHTGHASESLFSSGES